MSGEVILIPTLIDAGLLGELADWTGVMISQKLAPAARQLAHTLWDESEALAIERKQQMREWVSLQQEQQRERKACTQAEALIRATEKKLAQITLAAPQSRQNRTDTAKKDYLHLAEAHAPAQSSAEKLAQLAALVSALPAAFAQTPAHAKLIAHQARLQKSLDGGTLQQKSVQTFKEMITRALDAFVSKMDAQEKRRADMNERFERILTQALASQHIDIPQYADELMAFLDLLKGLLAAGELNPGQLDMIEKKWAALMKQMAVGLALRAQRITLSESLQRNLAELDYHAVEEFAPGAENLHASYRIPGGERLDITIDPQNQLHFNVLHETGKPEQQLSGEDLAKFRKQENRWCHDFRQVVRRLISEGFNYELRLEQILPQEAVKVVVVQTAAEIAAAEDDQDRFDDQRRQKFLD